MNVAQHNYYLTDKNTLKLKNLADKHNTTQSAILRKIIDDYRDEDDE